MKNFVLTCFSVLFVSTALFAQDSLWVELSPEFLAIKADTCRPPRLVAKAVVNYVDHSNAYFRVEGESEGQFFGYRLLASLESTQVVPDSGEIFIPDLLPDELYEFVTIDNCGEEVTLGVISTFSNAPSVTGIEVSGPMYSLIEAFQRDEAEGSVPLYDYVKDAENISIYEKISFVQSYFYKGQKFELDEGPVLPPYVPAPTTFDDCFCVFVFNTSQNAVPGTLLPDGSILPNTAVNEDEYEGKLHLSGDGDSFWWWATSVKGAAKSQSIACEGWHAGANDYEVSTEVINNVDASPYLGQVSFNLLCTNYANLPQACDCEKSIQVYYRYDTRVTAYGRKKGGGFLDKNAWAMAQDIAVVTLRNGSSDPEVIAGSTARAQAECNWDVNEDFWVELTSVAGSIATFFVSGSNTASLPTLIDNLSTQLGQLVSTPFLADAECDLSAEVEATLADGIIDDVVFHPNQPLYLNMFSFSNLRCGGKRSWNSYAQVHSDFYVSGIVPGGFGSIGAKDYCCTQKIGSWVLASMGGPLNSDEIASTLGFYFGTQGPWNMPSGPGNITELTEWGWDAVVVEESCIVEVNPEGNMQGGEMELRGEEEAFGVEDAMEPANREAVYVVYDISGRFVMRGTSQFDKTDVVNDFLNKAGDIPVGLYIIQLSEGTKREVVKVFYTK